MYEIYNQIWQEFIQFLNQKKWIEISTDALETFIGKPLTDIELLEEVSLLKFYEWYIWDYRLANNKRVFDYILSQIELPKAQLDVVSKWEYNPIRLVTVENIDDNYVYLLDLLTQEKFASLYWDDDLTISQPFLGRWVACDNELFMPTFTVFPVSVNVINKLYQQIEVSFRKYDGSMDDFVREYGYQFEEWIAQITELYKDNHFLVYDVLDYQAVLSGLLKSANFNIETSKIINLHGPIEFTYAVDGLSGKVTLDRDEMLFSSNETKTLEKVRVLFSYVFDYSLELTEEEYLELSNEELDEVIGFIDSFDWPQKNDYQVAVLLAEKLTVYCKEQILNGIILWYDFCSLNDLSYRKPATWAAAVEYAVQEIDAVNISKKELLTKYNVSNKTISEKYREIKKSLQLVIGDFRYSSLFS